METKKADRGTFWKFVLIMILALVVGGLVGFFSVRVEGGIKTVFAAFLTLLQTYAIHILLIGSVILIVGAVLFCHAGGKRAATLDPDDDKGYEEADRLYEIALHLSTVLQIFSFTFFAIDSGAGIESQGIFYLWHAVAFLVILFVNIGIQNKIVKAVKGLYPEKRGNVFDMKFQKNWYESCDEAERQQIGQAARKSMQATSNAILALFLITMLLGLYGLVSPFVPLCLGVIWFTQTQSYLMAAAKLGKKK